MKTDIIPRLPPAQLTLFYMLRKHCRRIVDSDYHTQVCDALYELMIQGGGTIGDISLSAEEAAALGKQYDLADGWICKIENEYVFLPRLPEWLI